MKRRSFALGFGAAAWPFASRAQPAGRVFRVGVLRLSAAFEDDMVALTLRELGYVEGRNLVLDQRFANGDASALPARARELVQLKPDVIVAVGLSTSRAAGQATAAIPIVMLGNFDPVAAGLVSSLARPGGNITGVLISSEGTLAGKRLELLKDAVPQARRIALLVPDDPSIAAQVAEVRSAAKSLDVEIAVVELRDGDFDRAFSTIVASGAGALFVAGHSSFFRDRKAIIERAAKHRLAATYEWPEQAVEGGLMAYGPPRLALYRRIAAYIDRILKGAKPGDMPIEQPTTFQLVVNLKTAQGLGIALPPSILLRADEVIE